MQASWAILLVASRQLSLDHPSWEMFLESCYSVMLLEQKEEQIWLFHWLSRQTMNHLAKIKIYKNKKMNNSVLVEITNGISSHALLSNFPFVKYQLVPISKGFFFWGIYHHWRLLWCCQHDAELASCSHCGNFEPIPQMEALAVDLLSFHIH